MKFCARLAYQLRGEQRAAEYYRRDGKKMSEEHKHDHGHDHGHAHDHSHDHKTRFHDPQHAAEFDRRTSEIRDDLAEKLADMLALHGDEQILDLATGTGRVARPVAKRLRTGRSMRVGPGSAVLAVGHHSERPV